MRFNEFTENRISDEIGNVISTTCSKYNPEKEINNLPYIELDCLEQNTGILLHTYNSVDQNSTKNIFKNRNILHGKLRPYLNKYYFTNF